MRLLLIAAGCALTLLALIWLGQRRLMYFPHHAVPPPAAVGLADVEQVAFTTQDGVELHGWFVPATQLPARATMLVCNGNAGNRAYRAELAHAFRSHGVAMLLFDYRGYGDNAGSPDERGLALDARAARRYLLSRPDVDAARLVYFGESLGAAVAVELAAEHPSAALVLRSPFTSMADVGSYHYPLLPVHLLLRDRYAAIDHIAQVRAPLLVIAGDADSIVPLEQSRRLHDAANSPKAFVVIEGADHNDAALTAGPIVVAETMRLLARMP
ncbi:pimelyl-[acyl-carrier protein] methyl ester esterase [Luteitalea pratensis]|uniref:Pimelyl-[acyl-carrier protein] methyl ester esterase n=1 Tax=Luteitalea pratensis TaxID=1855912 RepID=A0A143PJF7_LUTPR|nr:alpha/beta hydrolase [Luteitalea pratensis]AMY08697.1 pimelyl-[acyl-carrier protein] methyl ester esterase [Luteitalea pratensis]